MLRFSGDSTLNDNDPHVPKQRKKRQKRVILALKNEDGNLEEICPTDSIWYHLYVLWPNINEKHFLQKCQWHVCLLYDVYLQFVEDVRNKHWFMWWTGSNTTRKDSSPLELMVLVAFGYLGRGFIFDDIKESTAISEEVNRVFFTSLLKLEVQYCMTNMYTYSL